MIGFSSRFLGKVTFSADQALRDRTEAWLDAEAPARAKRIAAARQNAEARAKLAEAIADANRELRDDIAPFKDEAVKLDDGKARLDLIAPEFLIGTAEILAFGANKYGAYNWSKGMAWSRPFAALMRHMWAWWAGDKADPETGKSHLWHAACCLMFLVAYEARQTGKDDRPTKTP